MTWLDAQHVYSVSQFNRLVKLVLHDVCGAVRVSGEISNFTQPSSGHWYFTLKDDSAQLRCVMFRPQTRRAALLPANGLEVIVTGQASLYEARGEFQLIVETLDAAGSGALQRAFEQLKARLAAEGLFDAARKRALPSLPHAVGLITSPSGAAVHDMLTVLRRRFPAIPVILYPTSVQGAAAPSEIVAALATANRRQECAVLIVARGGGSAEDLAAFNDEAVVRAIAASAIPIISGVGHETDVTLSDFAADWRAPTPSAAAERAVPDWRDGARHLSQLQQRLTRHFHTRLKWAQQRLQGIARHLQALHPLQRLANAAQRLDHLELRLQQAQRALLTKQQARLTLMCNALLSHPPQAQIALQRQRLQYVTRRLGAALTQQLAAKRQCYLAAQQTLYAVSPLATLQRGYAIVTPAHDPTRIIKRAAEVAVGESVLIRLAHDALVARVESQQRSELDDTESPL